MRRIAHNAVKRACLVAVALGPSLLQAQTIYDAARLTEHGPVGTARSIGMGGAFTAVGGDWASASLNPAGLGVFRRGQLFFSPSLHIGANEANLLGQTTTDNAATFSVPNLGLVVTGKTKNEEGLKRWTFALGYNQTAHFRRNVSAAGFNDVNSVSTFLGSNAGTTPEADLQFGGPYQPSDFTAQAYNTYANQTGSGIINPFGNIYIGAFEQGRINQTLAIEERGRSNEWNIGLAGNISDRVFVGASLLVDDFRYQFSRTLIEKDIDNVYNDVTNTNVAESAAERLQISDEYSTRGSSVGLAFGLIAQPLDFMRVGASIRTPKWYSLTDQYSNSMSIHDDLGDFNEQTSLAGTFDYNFVSPWVANVGAMFQFGKMGILSVDGGYTDFSTVRYAKPNQAALFTNLNREIGQYLTSAYNLRLGGELRLGDFYLRAGAGYYTSNWTTKGQAVEQPFNTPAGIQPAQTPKQEDLSRIIVTGGLGYRGKSAFFDVAYMHSIRQDLQTLYVGNPFGTTLSAFSDVGSPVVTNRRTVGTLMFTLGFLLGKSR